MDETDTPPLAERLRRALDKAERSVRESGYAWMDVHQIPGAVVDLLIERDRALLEDHRQSPVWKPLIGDPVVVEHCFWCSFGQSSPVAAPCTEVRRAAAFWLGERGT